MSTFKLDITKDRCPMTFVKTKLQLEQMADGDLLEVLLSEGEPLEMVPKTVVEQGFQLLEKVHVRERIHKLVIKK